MGERKERKDLMGIEDIDSIKNGHAETKYLVNMFARHQVWLVEHTSASADDKKAKNRAWYVINPSIGRGNILAAPISRTYINGIPIDIGKNFEMYINLENARPVCCGSFIQYIGVGSERTQTQVEEALQALFFCSGSSDILSRQSTRQASLFAERDTSLRISGFDKDLYADQNAMEIAKLIRQTPVGTPIDTRLIHMMNIYVGNKRVMMQTRTGRSSHLIPEETVSAGDCNTPHSPTSSQKALGAQTSKPPLIASEFENPRELTRNELEFIRHSKCLRIINMIFRLSPNHIRNIRHNNLTWIDKQPHITSNEISVLANDLIWSTAFDRIVRRDISYEDFCRIRTILISKLDRDKDYEGGEFKEYIYQMAGAIHYK